MRSDFWWYVARSGGIVAWGLATASVLWGLALSSGAFAGRTTNAKLLDLHRFLGGLSLVFAVIHGAGLVLQDGLGFGPLEVLVPMTADRAASAVAWGIVAFYLLVAVELTSLLRERVGEAAWRRTHYGGFGVFLFGTMHGLEIGTDVDNPLIWWPAAIASAGVVGLCAYRIFSGDAVTAPAAAPAAERPSARLLERTLTELERLDTSAYPQAAVPPSPLPPPAPPASVEPLSMFTTGGPVARHPATSAPSPAPGSPAPGPGQPPVPSRAPVSESLLARSLPTRVPQRLEATTAPAAGLGAWQPARAASTRSGGPPPPPDAVDPSTGEPDPAAYRKWLREWLAYVESQA